VKHKARCLKQMEDSDSAIATLEDTISKAPAHGLFHNGRAVGPRKTHRKRAKNQRKHGDLKGFIADL
jgi:hypothetical protein